MIIGVLGGFGEYLVYEVVKRGGVFVLFVCIEEKLYWVVE